MTRSVMTSYENGLTFSFCKLFSYTKVKVYIITFKIVFTQSGNRTHSPKFLKKLQKRKSAAINRKLPTHKKTLFIQKLWITLIALERTIKNTLCIIKNIKYQNKKIKKNHRNVFRASTILLFIIFKGIIRNFPTFSLQQQPTKLIARQCTPFIHNTVTNVPIYYPYIYSLKWCPVKALKTI